MLLRGASLLLAIALSALHPAHAKLLVIEGAPYNASIIMRFPVGGGLSNQHYMILTGMTLALGMEVDKVLFPPLLSRSSFAVEDPDNTNFTIVRPETIYNIPYIRQQLAKHGIELDASAAERVDHVRGQAQFHHLRQEGQKLAVQLIDLPYNTFEERVYDDSYWRDAVLQHLVKHKDKLKDLVTEDGTVTMYARAPVLLYALDLTSTHLTVEASRLLRFNPKLQVLARRVVGWVEAHTGSPWFDGMHLRLEEDSHAWFGMFEGGEDGMWENYRHALKQLDLKRMPVYIASGIWSQYDVSDVSKEMQEKVDAFMREQGLSYFYKEMALPSSDLQQLTSEQLALLDTLVLIRARHFVGYDKSTMSRLVREIRATQGVARDTSYLVSTTQLSGYWTQIHNETLFWKGSTLPVCYDCRVAPVFDCSANFEPETVSQAPAWDSWGETVGELQQLKVKNLEASRTKPPSSDELFEPASELVRTSRL